MKIEPFVVGMTGLSGAGKTYYVDSLKARFGNNITVVGFDDYYKPLDLQHIDEFGEANYDLPTALFSDQFHEDLMQLLQYHPVMIKKYQFEHYDAPEVVATVSPAPILLVEGLFVMEFKPVDSLLNYRVFIDCDTDLCYDRRLKRDIAERNIPEARSVHQWKHHVMPAYNQYILPHKDRCDLVVWNEGAADKNIEIMSKAIMEKAHPTVIEALLS